MIVVVDVEFTCRDELMAKERVERTRIDYPVTFVGVREGKLPPGTDETRLPEYRRFHGCTPIEVDAFAEEVDDFSDGLRNYLITIEIDTQSPDVQTAMQRVIAIPFGDRDCGFRIVGTK